MNERGLLDLIIARLPALNCRDKICLAESFNREDDLIVLSKEDIERILGHELRFFWDIDTIRAMAERDEKIARMRLINMVPWGASAYPPLLREIYDPPSLLFFRGQLPNPEKPLLAIVGTRRPSSQAGAQAFGIARDLGRRGISVVSGLALGIDAMAHRGNIEGGAPTFGILGSGADEVYPSANRALAKRILETGGALISEYPPGTGPRKWNFPARNRIISGLARSVLIVEAPERSGALITAGFALEQGKELWAASAGLVAANAKGASFARTLYDKRGTVKLVGDGAEIISSAADVLEKWKWETGTAESGNREAVGNTAAASLVACAARDLDIDL
ncbi:DNA processing protein DprA [Spirochaetia bacterium]|nr:DNA processing protein DprA [Spirochaetia bacterium]